MRSLIFLLVFGAFALANDLVLQEGKIAAHTEVFGDSTIDPVSTQIDSKLTMDDTIETIKGTLSIPSLSLISDNKDRDKHMYDVLKIDINPTIAFNIVSITKAAEDYKIKGFLTLNKVVKQVETVATISDDNGTIALDGNFSILLTDYGMEPPSMFFVTVRDQIDIHYTLTYKKG